MSLFLRKFTKNKVFRKWFRKEEGFSTRKRTIFLPGNRGVGPNAAKRVVMRAVKVKKANASISELFDVRKEKRVSLPDDEHVIFLGNLKGSNQPHREQTRRSRSLGCGERKKVSFR